MGSVSRNKPKLAAAFPLIAFAAALYLLGTSPARAPEQALACPLPEEAAAEPLDPVQRALAEFLSRRFQVAAEATGAVVSTAWDAAQASGLDPLLVLAVISVESRFNPVAESRMGAKGLMQIIPRYHLAKLAAHGGEDAVLDSESNIRVGTRILKEYIRRTGTLEAGLQFYNGASHDPAAVYTQKVLAERSRLEQVVRTALRRASAPGATQGS